MQITWTGGVVLCLFLIILALSAGCMNSAPMPADKVVSSRMTPADLEILVNQAAVYAGNASCDASLARYGGVGSVPRAASFYFGTPNGEIFTLASMKGRTGEGWQNGTDARGLRVLAMAQETARSGGGFIAYLSPSPEGRSGDDAAIDGYVPRIGYVHPFNSTGWMGAGMDLSDLSGSGPEPGPVVTMQILVRQGAEYGQKYGKERAFAEISNRSGLFVDAGRHYIYAYDYNGTLLAHPYLPDKVGTSLINRTDPFGMKNIQALCNTAKAGGGYIVFVWPNPDAGNRQETKIGYVLPVDDTWWVGSGVYLGEVTGKPAYYPEQVGLVSDRQVAPADT